jgi:hypothetical protein
MLLRGPASGIPAYLMCAIVFIRHIPNLKEIVQAT